MAAASSVIVKLTVTGEELVTQVLESKSIDLAEKIEYDIVLNNSSKEIDFSYVSNIEAILFITDADVTVEFTISSETVDFEINGIYLLNPTSSFITSLDSIVIRNDATTNKTVKVRIYGGSS